MEIKTENRQQTKRSLQQQILDVAPVVLDFVILIVQVFYYIIEATFRLFKPVDPEPVKEELVLVTGAGHGIGREIALQYASEGCTLVLWDVNQKGNEETAKLIEKSGGPKAHTYTCDVSDRQNVLSVAEKVKQEVGDVTILINNAGIMPTHPLEKHTEAEIRKITDINVLAHFWTLEAFLPAMKKNNHGHIVSLSSIAGVVGIPNLVPYTASKFAVRGYMEALMDELNWNPYNQIKTTTICPFMVNTGLCKKPYVKFEKMLNLLDPKTVAEKIMYAQRTGVMECTIPSYLLKVNHLTRYLLI